MKSRISRSLFTKFDKSLDQRFNGESNRQPNDGKYGVTGGMLTGSPIRRQFVSNCGSVKRRSRISRARKRHDERDVDAEHRIIIC